MTGSSHPAFAAAVRRHHAAVFRCALRVLGSADDASDVTQQVFARVCAGRVRLPGDTERDLAVLRWVTVRQARNQLRGRRRRQRHEQERARMRPEAHHDPEPLGGRDERLALQAALADLPAQLRLPVELHFLEEMSFTDLARALACSKSTAHGLVQQGLDGLRRRLQGAGHGALAAALPMALTRHALPPIGPPAGLAEQLVQAGAGGVVAAGTASKWLAAAGLTVALAAGGGWAMAVASDAESETAPMSRVAVADPASGMVADPPSEAASVGLPVDASPGRSAVELGGDSDPVPGALLLYPTGDTDAPTGRVSGAVTDEDGAPLPGALVYVSSLEYGGKGPRFSRRDRTDASGEFVVDVPVVREGGQSYRAHAQLEAHSVARSATVRVAAGDELRLPSMALRSLVDDRSGAWQQQVLVRDPQGRPVPGAEVRVERVTLQGELPADQEERRVLEFGGVTDDLGAVQVAGTHLGEKRLVVRQTRDPRLGAAVLRYGQAELGTLAPRVVQLDVGRRVAGVIRWALDGAPAAGIHFEAIQPDLGMRELVTDDRGRFECGGLLDLPVTLRAWPGTHSGFLVEGVAPDSLGLDLRIKRSDDPRPVGLSLGELHGRVVDAATGEPVAIRTTALRTHWLGDETVDESTIRHELLPEMLAAPPVQIMLPDGADMDTWEEPTSSEVHEVGLGAGHVLLLAWADDHAVGWSGPFEVGPGVVHGDLVLRLHRGATVSGRVVDVAGRPVDGAVVWVGGRATLQRLPRIEDHEDEPSRAELAAELRRRRYPSWRTDAQGRFSLEHLPAGSDLVIHAVAPDDAMGHGGLVTLREGERREVGVITLR